MTQYVVQPGDSISLIANKFYGTYKPIGTFNPITAIAQASGVSNPNVISVGQTLTIPDKPGTAANSSTVTVANSGSGTTIPSASSSSTTTTKTTTTTTKSSSSLVWWILGGMGLAGLAAYGLKKMHDKKKAKK